MIKKIENVEELDKILINTYSCISPKKLKKEYLLTKSDFNKSLVNYAYFYNSETIGYLRSIPSNGNQIIDYLKFFNQTENNFNVNEEEFISTIEEIAFFYRDFQHVLIKQNKLRTHIGNLTNQFKTHILSLDLNPKPKYITEIKNNINYHFVDLKEFLI
ncbi:MAG: hypothetical protein ACMXX8_01805 [Candidatus Woesearchaeota archaeon]